MVAPIYMRRDLTAPACNVAATVCGACMKILVVPQGSMMSPAVGPIFQSRDMMVDQKDIMINIGLEQC